MHLTCLLNLVLVDVVKSVAVASEYFVLLERHYVFVSGSSVHDMWLKIQKDMHPGEIPKELKKLSDTIDGRPGMLLAELCVTDYRPLFIC